MEELFKKAERLVGAAKARNRKLALAESCTGGMVAMAVTSVAGVSTVFDRGFITYSNAAKQKMLRVSEQTLYENGAVSAECVREMARGAVENSEADIAVSVSGIAGPDGGSDEKPVGLVFLGVFDKNTGKNEAYEYKFSGNRHEVRLRAAIEAIEILIKVVS